MRKTIVALAGLLAVAPAWGNEQECGYGWNWYNAPAGAVVLSRSDDVISTVMNSVGEWYTHSTVAAGDGYNMFHSTMGDPAMCFYAFGGFQVCTSDIKDPSPGPSRASVAGYNLFLNSSPLADVSTYYKDVGSGYEGLESNLASWMWNPNGGWARFGAQNGLDRYRYNGATTTYRMDQYKNSYSAGWGGIPSSNPGLVCSTFIAHASYKANGWAVNDKEYRDYPGAPGVCAIAGNVKGALKSKCENSVEWWNGWAVDCSKNANDVTNCFINRGKCGDSSTWYKNNCASPAYSVSPDRLIGRNGNQGGGIHQDAPWYPLSWGGDVVYSCWN